jgi:hypothetical protein
MKPDRPPVSKAVAGKAASIAASRVIQPLGPAYQALPPLQAKAMPLSPRSAAKLRPDHIPTPAEWAELVRSHPEHALSLPPVLQQWFQAGLSAGCLQVLTAASPASFVNLAAMSSSTTPVSVESASIASASVSTVEEYSTVISMKPVPPSGTKPVAFRCEVLAWHVCAVS